MTRRPLRPVALVLVLAVAAGTVAVSCSRSEPSAAPTSTARVTAPLGTPLPGTARRTPRSEATDRAAAFIAGAQSSIDPMTMLVLANLGAHHDYPELTALRAKAIEQIAGGWQPWYPPGKEAALKPVWERVAAGTGPVPAGMESFTAANPPEALELTVYPMVLCGGPGFPEDYGRVLSKALELEDTAGYIATHVALSLVIARERGCTLTGAAGLRNRLVNLFVEKLAGTTEVDDITMERLLVLVLLGAKDRIDPVWVERVLAAQQPDGGWQADAPSVAARTPTGSAATATTRARLGSQWHSTFVALWFLEAYAADTPPPYFFLLR